MTCHGIRWHWQIGVEPGRRIYKALFMSILYIMQLIFIYDLECFSGGHDHLLWCLWPALVQGQPL